MGGVWERLEEKQGEGRLGVPQQGGDGLELARLVEDRVDTRFVTSTAHGIAAIMGQHDHQWRRREFFKARNGERGCDGQPVKIEQYNVRLKSCGESRRFSRRGSGTGHRCPAQIAHPSCKRTAGSPRLPRKEDAKPRLAAATLESFHWNQPSVTWSDHSRARVPIIR